MRRSVIVLGIVLALVGCSDDEGSDAGGVAGQTVEPAAPIDVEAAEERHRVVCERTVASDQLDDCLAASRAAIQAAVEVGCPATALDAWAEHVVAWRFATTPHDDFFARCPLPLSNLVMRAVPDRYQPATAQRGLGLLDGPGVAEGFAASAEVERFLVQLGHEVSYAAAWVDGDDLVLVRLDRFARPDQAAAFLDSDHDTGAGSGTGGTVTQVPGILQSRVLAVGASHLATGRVCEVVVTLHAQGSGGGGLTTDEVVAWFSDQARRVQTAVAC